MLQSQNKLLMDIDLTPENTVGGVLKNIREKN